ncbi:uncharacterized protein LOC117170917 [Belonocnema kinseyi]|uniref:uncharacterized protein LOC117170917 n=1 Tax=Belonocnema kinseyi TaxID=2817044 RepID=UPI00143D01BB|nr:uncharacterized protein LOC117170917 [Belonocnema kinseyi]
MASQEWLGRGDILRSTRYLGSLRAPNVTTHGSKNPEICTERRNSPNLNPCNVFHTLYLEIENTYLCCDSAVTLAWINSPSNHCKTFVANRVSEIQNLVPNAICKHIRSKDNPTDILSRGLNAVPLAVSGLCKLSVVVKKRGYVVQLSHQIKRVVADILRFKHKVQNPLNRHLGFLTLSELDQSMQILIKLYQMEAFPQDLKCLQQKRALDSLNGQLSLADHPESQKCPIILPSKHHHVELLIREEHYKNLHVSSRGLSTLLRLQFWILRSQWTINNLLRKCIVCFRCRPPSFKQLMRNLPATRSTPERPLLNTGIDDDGHFVIKISRNVTGKAYLAVFVCFALKAVRLEVVSDASTPAFLNTLKRFIARTGKSSHIYSDNGENFVDANNQLKALSNLLSNNKFQNDIGNYLTRGSVYWSIVALEWPHFGGLWESAVILAKTLIKKIIGLTSLTFEELSTVVTEVEAVSNSRPLCALSNEPNDLNSLTPGHFLIGESMTANPHEDIPDLIKPGTLVLLREDDALPLMWLMGRFVKVHPGKDGVIRVISVRTASNVIKRSLKGISVLPINV